MSGAMRGMPGGSGNVRQVGLAGGLHPIRPGLEKCAFYWKTKSCKIGETCKFDQTTSQDKQTQPASLSADAPFAAALEAIPPDDWCRTWAAGRTIMLRRTSKRVEEEVDKIINPNP